MKDGKNNIEKRNGRSGFGWYGDFTAHGRRFRPFLGTDLRKAEEAARKVTKSQGFREFAEEFLRLHSARKRSKRRDQFSVKVLSEFFGAKKLRDITAHDVELYREVRLSQDTKRGSKLSPASVNRELACLRTLFNKAVLWGKLEESPMNGVKKNRESNGRMRVLTFEEELRLIENAAPHLRPILVVLLNTGLRRGEALGLRWGDVDFNEEHILIGDSKSGKSRTVPLNTAAFSALHELRRNGLPLFNGTWRPADTDHVFGGLVEIKRSFHTACKLAELDNLRLHDLRHTFASNLVRRGVDIVTVSRLLGHSSIQMTMRYAHPDENLHSAVQRLCSQQASRQVESTGSALPAVNSSSRVN
jgi:integrase